MSRKILIPIILLAAIVLAIFMYFWPAALPKSGEKITVYGYYDCLYHQRVEGDPIESVQAMLCRHGFKDRWGRHYDLSVEFVNMDNEHRKITGKFIPAKENEYYDIVGTIVEDSSEISFLGRVNETYKNFKHYLIWGNQ